MKKSGIVIPVIVLWCVLCQACRGGASSADELQQAVEMGHRHASRLDAAKHELTERDIQSILLQVRAKEYQMRQYGLNRAADTYISAFQERLAEINDSLAQMIF